MESAVSQCQMQNLTAESDSMLKNSSDFSWEEKQTLIFERDTVTIKQDINNNGTNFKPSSLLSSQQLRGNPWNQIIAIGIYIEVSY